jgi:GntR family transcriptional repressor for pyruvate dehydrogenase complex
VADPNGDGPLLRPVVSSRARTLKRSEVVAREIVEDVVRRRLQPGDVLAPEGVMLAQYGVGRVTLREGLRLLEAQGLLTLRPGPGGGAVVSGVDASDLGGTATLFFRLAGATYREVGNALRTLQPMLVQRIAERPDHKAVAAELYAAIEASEAVGDQPDGVFRVGPEFHALVATLGGNPVLSTFANALGSIFTTRVLSVVDLEPGQAEFLAAHRTITKAIADGHATRARQLAYEHEVHMQEYCEERAGGRLSQVVEWL